MKSKKKTATLKKVAENKRFLEKTEHDTAKTVISFLQYSSQV